MYYKVQEPSDTVDAEGHDNWVRLPRHKTVRGDSSLEGYHGAVLNLVILASSMGVQLAERLRLHSNEAWNVRMGVVNKGDRDYVCLDRPLLEEIEALEISRTGRPKLNLSGFFTRPALALAAGLQADAGLNAAAGVTTARAAGPLATARPVVAGQAPLGPAAGPPARASHPTTAVAGSTAVARPAGFERLMEDDPLQDAGDLVCDATDRGDVLYAADEATEIASVLQQAAGAAPGTFLGGLH